MAADNQVFLATLGVLAGLIALVTKLVADRRNGNANGNGNGPESYAGPERRREMTAVHAEIASLRSAVERNAKGIKELAAEVAHRFDRHDELQRMNDTQTAKEIGQLVGAMNSIEKTVAAALGFRGETRTTPPGGEKLP